MPPTPPERRTVSRAAGLSIVAATALLVFVFGSKLWPVPAPSAQVVPAVASAPPAPPRPLPPTSPSPALTPTDGGSPADAVGSTATLSPQDAGVVPEGADAKTLAAVDASSLADASSEDAGAAEPTSTTRAERKKRRKEATVAAAVARPTKQDGAGVPVDSPKDARGANAPLPPSDGSDGSDGSAATTPGEPSKEANAADCALADKDMARESWRRNWPTVCSAIASGKAFILIPIKGPLEGESHALHRRPTREARINLPAGSGALLTMKQYKVRRLGFKELRVDIKDDGGTRLRVKLQPGAGDPLFEVKDGFAKITVAIPN